MSSVLVKNIGTLVTGDLKSPLRRADSIYVEDGIVRVIGNGLNHRADFVVDARGITAIPGLIDSHSHPTFGDFTPAQNSLSWITHYMHGGVTALVSAGELHLPGLPLPPDPKTALSLALVAKRCWDNLRPPASRFTAVRFCLSLVSKKAILMRLALPEFGSSSSSSMTTAFSPTAKPSAM